MKSASTTNPKFVDGGAAALPHVRIRKIGKQTNAPVATAEWNEYEPGSAANAKSLPEGYVMAGWLLQPIRVGWPVKLLRMDRNGVAVLGYFESTVVESLIPGGFETKNSIYQVDLIPLPDSGRND